MFLNNCPVCILVAMFPHLLSRGALISVELYSKSGRHRVTFGGTMKSMGLNTYVFLMHCFYIDRYLFQSGVPQRIEGPCLVDLDKG